MQQQISVITLDVADLVRSRRFYVEGFGWKVGGTLLRAAARRVPQLCRRSRWPRLGDRLESRRADQP
jgi:hypothetical protein